MEQPDFSNLLLRMTCTTPLDRRGAEPHDEAFDRYAIELLHVDDDGVPACIATALVFRIRSESRVPLAVAVDSEPRGDLLEQVCADALDDAGMLVPVLAERFEPPPTEFVVLDQIEFAASPDV